MDENGVFLGRYADEDGGVAFLSDDDRRRHLYVLGRSGTGKTTLNRLMIYSDIDRHRGLALIDPHGDIAELVADSIPRERENHTIYIDPSDAHACLGLNPLYRVPIDKRPLVASQIVDAFSHLWKLGPETTPRLIYILYNGLRLLLDAPSASLLGLQRLLIDDAYRYRLLAHCSDPAVRNFWECEFAELSESDAATAVASSQNKLGMLFSGSTRNILGQVTPTIDFRRVMDRGEIVIFNLAKAKLGEGPAHLLGAFVVSALAQAAESRADIPEEERKDFSVYCEEFQTYSSSALLSGISESRKWHLAWVLSHQQLLSLPPTLARSLIGGIGSAVAFRTAGHDAETLQAELNNSELLFDQSKLAYINVAKPVNLTDTANFFAYMKLLDHGMPTKTRLVEIDFPEPPITGRLKAIRNRSRARYMRPRKDVEAAISRFLVPTAKRKAEAVRDPWPASLKVFRRALTRALREHSMTIDIAGVAVSAVDMQHVHNLFLALHVSAGVTAKEREDEREKIFRRASQAAQRQHLIGALERDGTQWVWILQ